MPITPIGGPSNISQPYRMGDDDYTQIWNLINNIKNATSLDEAKKDVSALKDLLFHEDGSKVIGYLCEGSKTSQSQLIC